MVPKKSLGQHWLHDAQALDDIAESAEIIPGDHILEIGPGLGTLTEVLLSSGAHVTAVEIDQQLFERLKEEATMLYSQDAKQLQLVNQDILKFDFGSLPIGYKVVANIPYYLTGKLLRLLAETANPPSLVVLLVQKEVAERLYAGPGKLSLLAVSVQLYFEPQLGRLVPAKLFTPPPKVDSQVIILRRRVEPLFSDLDDKVFFRLVKAGFSEKRKKLRSSLAGGLKLEKAKVDGLLVNAGLSADARAQELSLGEWHQLYQAFRQLS